MEDNLYAPPKSKLEDIASSSPARLYSPRQIYTATFVGGPLAGAWFLSRNFRVLSRGPESSRAIAIGVAVTVCLFPILLVLPEKFPRLVIPIAYSYAFRYFATRRFAANAAEGISFVCGWQNWFTVVGVAILWAIPALLFFTAASLLMDRFFPSMLPP